MRKQNLKITALNFWRGIASYGPGRFLFEKTKEQVRVHFQW